MRAPRRLTPADIAGRYFEDFRVGDVFETPGVTVTEAQIVDFGLRYDPNVVHLDAEAAADTPFGGLIASGFQTLALTFRLFFQSGVIGACSIAGQGLDKVRWHRPVRPGDTLRTTAEVVEVRPSASRPDRGTLRMVHRTFNQRGEEVLSLEAAHLVRRRPQAGPDGG